MSVISLTTDFGQTDGYVGAMKGVILAICPPATLVDITHDISPQNVRQAAYVLATAAPFFPSGTVHLVVVDPGVGSQRRPIAIQTDRAFFVGPDNGVFSYCLELSPFCETRNHMNPEGKAQKDHLATQVVELANPVYWRSHVSHTFHGRDIFAPVAAHLAQGVLLSDLGPAIEMPVILDIPKPRREVGGRILGHVLHTDRFGNLISNIPAAWLEPPDGWRFEIAGHCINGLCSSYADAAPGTLLALVSSGNTLEIAACDANAAQQLGVTAGHSLTAARRPM